MKQLSDWFPELETLIGLRQNARFHPEGDVWSHTMQVLDEAAALRAEAREPLWFMLAALCHDFGKAVASEEVNGLVHAYGHEKQGIPLAGAFLGRLTKEAKLTQYVLNMTALHMKPNMLVDNSAHIKSYMKMFDQSICPEDLLLLAKADSLGRVGPGDDGNNMRGAYAETESRLRELLALYRERMSRPCLMGRDLLEAGLKPGPRFHDALEQAHKLRLAGLSKEEQLKAALALLRGKDGEGGGAS